MKFFSQILLVFLLLSVTAERVAHFWTTPKKTCLYAENEEQPEESMEGEKEKDKDEAKDKISMYVAGHLHMRPSAIPVNDLVINHKRSAFLKQPYLPPDQL